MPELIAVTDSGLYCEAGDFYVDPWRPVHRAVLTHAHGDHAVPESGSYLCSSPGLSILRHRLGPVAQIQAQAYREPLRLGAAKVSLHPAGHVLGSAQVRIEAAGSVWVVSGDYKRAPDPTCEAFEVVGCDAFITEATFALPVYRWEEPGHVVGDIFQWWEENRSKGAASILFCYALGKSQRILAHLTSHTDRPVWIHGAIAGLTEHYRGSGIHMVPTRLVSDAEKGADFAGELILAPPSARGTNWMRRFGEASIGFASGWMRLRGTRRRRGFNRGFALSDHADWPALLRTVEETGARRVLAMHGYSEQLARFLADRGLETGVLTTPFPGESEEGG